MLEMTYINKSSYDKVVEERDKLKAQLEEEKRKTTTFMHKYFSLVRGGVYENHIS